MSKRKREEDDIEKEAAEIVEKETKESSKNPEIISDYRKFLSGIETADVEFLESNEYYMEDLSGNDFRDLIPKIKDPAAARMLEKYRNKVFHYMLKEADNIESINEFLIIPPGDNGQKKAAELERSKMIYSDSDNLSKVIEDGQLQVFDQVLKCLNASQIYEMVEDFSSIPAIADAAEFSGRGCNNILLIRRELLRLQEGNTRNYPEDNLSFKSELEDASKIAKKVLDEIQMREEKDDEASDDEMSMEEYREHQVGISEIIVKTIKEIEQQPSSAIDPESSQALISNLQKGRQ